MVKVCVSYLYSVIYSEQLSYTKFFDPGNLYRYRKLSAELPEGDGSMSGVLGGVVDQRIPYSYSLYFSDKFLCINYFNPSYGLKDIN